MVRRASVLNVRPRAFIFALILCVLILPSLVACSLDGWSQQGKDQAQETEAAQQESASEVTAGVTGGEHRGRGSVEVVMDLGTPRRVVALTFDMGEGAGYTEQILDTLEANGVRASFGVTGGWARANPALLRRIVDEGHTIINHSYSHPSFTGFSMDTAPLSHEERVEEVRKTESAIKTVAGVSAKPYFRPPYGDYDHRVLRDVYALGYRYNVMWSVDPLGWRGLAKEQILRRVLDGLRPGAIYIFHVDATQDGPALPAIISALRERGYGFATIDDFYR